PDRGPLGGIHAALAHFRSPTFIVACDMPFLCPVLIEHMSLNFGGDALVPEGESGPEPLHGIYSPVLIERFRIFLESEAKTPSLRRVLSLIDIRILAFEAVRTFDPALRCFANWNTPEDIEGAQTGA
ncbi:molybdenum cofactor guanylyltransferase, partial [bacterium]